jgi:PKD repeat protein
MRSCGRSLCSFLVCVAGYTAGAAERYVALGNPGAAAPYTNWASAAATIQPALDVAQAGETVWVSNGVYATGGAAAAGLMSRVSVTNPVAVRSVNGPGSAMIVGQPGSFGQWNDACRGVYLAEGAVLDGFTVSNGFSDLHGYGAGVYGAGPGAVLTNCLLTANIGGGAYGATLVACVLSNNLSSGGASRGGGARASVLHGCLLVGNTSEGDGGGAADSVLSNCLVRGNVSSSAGGQGGGAAGSTLYDCLVTSNRANLGGGVDSSVARGCTLEGNAAPGDSGGGALASLLEHCLVTNNSAGGVGGGVADGTSRYCRIVNNWSWSQGGGAGVYFEPTARLENCVVAGNESTRGGGVSGMHLYHCTVVDNEATEQGGGAYLAQAYNSIIYFNRALNDPATDEREGLVGSYTCTRPPPAAGIGNITNAPLLGGADNLHLLAGSPCIDAGSDAWAICALDQDGEARTNGLRVDMGADEFYATAPEPPAAAIAAPWGTRVVAGYPLPLEAAIPLRLPGTVFSWSFGDGAGTNEVESVRHAWVIPGVYEVVLAVTNLGGSAAATASVEVVNLAAGTRYARTNGNDAADGSTWAAAKATLQGAVDAVDAVGGLVLASNGVYASGSAAVEGGLSNRVVVKVATTVRSVNGPAVTVIRGKLDPTPGGLGPAALRGVYLNEEARLIGFTVTSGATAMVVGPAGSGAGLFSAGSGVAASNCVLSGNVAFHQGGGAWSGRLEQCTIQGNRAQEGAGCFAGVLFHSLLAGNVATSAGGGTCYAELNNCLLYSNRAHQGGAAFGGRLVHCTVQGNTAGDSGGGLYAGEALNSILYYNLANSSPNAFDGTLSYCCTHPLPVSGPGNFTNSPGTSGLHDPRLPLGSACIDAGSALPTPWAKDWHGEPRTNGVAVDVGADEYWPAGLTGLLTCAIATPNGTAVVAGAPLALQAQLSGTPLFFTWSMGDGVELTNVPAAGPQLVRPRKLQRGSVCRESRRFRGGDRFGAGRRSTRGRPLCGPGWQRRTTGHELGYGQGDDSGRGRGDDSRRHGVGEQRGVRDGRGGGGRADEPGRGDEPRDGAQRKRTGQCHDRGATRLLRAVERCLSGRVPDRGRRAGRLHGEQRILRPEMAMARACSGPDPAPC